MTSETLLPNVYWRPVFWEPVTGTGERLMVGALVEWDGHISWHRLVRSDVLDCLYGKASSGVKTLLDTGLEALCAVGAQGALQNEMPSLLGLEPGPLRHTHANNVVDALRTAALLYSSLSNIDKLDQMEEIDAPSQEEGNRRFTTDVKERVITNRPELSQYFGRSAVLIEGGEQTKFGYVSPRSIIHFGVLSPVRQPAGLRDARARLWELRRAQEYSGIPFAGLIFGVPSDDDPTLSSRQIDAMRRNLREIEQEADTYQMRFFAVTSAQAGADKLLEHA
ncbi:hypothetical protein J5T34_18585 [Cupriavidus gilardii]|uniref:hypothetical protein n=1 Tax=Cupriavidus gilardii TaxID=82541 RepID=UPI001ABE6667|nr:hypothetical protein [Cupriavidus gilardii]MBO4122739.1 hypothetical protein [Cupriavidus gilardii]